MQQVSSLRSDAGVVGQEGDQLPTSRAQYLRMLEAFRPLWQARLASGGHSPEQLRLTSDALGELLAASTS